MNYKNGVSVIIPVYNAGKTIKKCIDSILFQVYTQWELILVDDGSTDNSGVICDEYADKYDNIKALHIKNDGVSNARNTGMNEVETEYFVFVDSDDWVEPDYIQNLIDAKEQFPEAGHFWSCLQSVNPDGEVINRYVINNEEYNVFDKSQAMTLMQSLVLQCPYNKLNSTKIVKENNLKMNVDSSLGEDLMFNFDYIEISGNDKIVVINKASYNYLVGNDESLDNKFRANLLEITIELKEFIKSYLDKWSVDKSQYDLYWNSYFSSIIDIMENTMSEKNPQSYNEKINFNNSILNSDLFETVLENKTAYVNPLVLKALKSKNYKNVIRANKLAKIKNKILG